MPALKIPPVAQVILAAILMQLGAALFPSLRFEIPFQTVAASLCIFSGVLACTLGIAEFRRVKTTVNPMRPESASSLVRTGIYGRTRNPIYLGFLLLLLGLAIYRANLAAFLALPGFVLYMTRFQIKPEERALTAIFGSAFEEYCSAVRRWI